MKEGQQTISAVIFHASLPIFRLYEKNVNQSQIDFEHRFRIYTREWAHFRSNVRTQRP